MSLLGIDIGSSSCKGVAFTVDGIELARASASYCPVTVGSSVEIETTVFREAVFNVILALTGQLSNDLVEALAISSHGETVIAIDKNGNATGPAIMNADNRAEEEAAWWEKTFGREEIYKITGLPLHPMFSLNKVMWIRNHRPELYAITNKFVSVSDYVLTQLGFPPYTDYSLACRTMAFDIHNRCWSQKILEHCGIPIEKLGIPLAAGTVVGKLSAEIASTLGLREGIVVALGGHDQPCGALGAGAIRSGDVVDSAGTYECLTAVSQTPMNSNKSLGYSLNSYCHVVPGKFVTLAFFPAGMVSAWFTKQFYCEEKKIEQESKKDLHTMLDENTMSFCPGPSGLCTTPHFAGSGTPYWDARATGVMAGFTPDTTIYHLYKGIFEGIACELAINISVLEEIIGPFGSMNISGGNSRSRFTVQLRADMTRKQINLLVNDETVCLGAAVLAGIAAGKYEDAEEAVEKVVRVKETILPDHQSQLAYEKQFDRYKLLYRSLERFREV
ncbi:MAG TPA: FGGY-family carbohydrate kinase [Flavitalea sp.]|nr:FGGY-family carbohydrate kinase [Flavitalea sp.]